MSPIIIEYETKEKKSLMEITPSTVFKWNPEKNEKLKRERDITFEEIIYYLQSDALVDDIEHPDQVKYKNQRVLVLKIKDYIHTVPYIEDTEHNVIFLKTIFKNRKLNKIYE